MSEYFKIVEKFNTTGRGPLYIMNVSEGAVLRIGDVLSDLHGNRIKVAGIEMTSRPLDLPIEKWPVGALFEEIDGNPVIGKYLAIDLAKTADGKWIVIEVNDAQESGFVGINPIILWNNTISAMQTA